MASRSVYCRSRDESDGVQEAGSSPARSRHCNRGANPKKPPFLREGRGSGDPEVRRLVRRFSKTDRGEDPEGGS